MALTLSEILGWVKWLIDTLGFGSWIAAFVLIGLAGYFLDTFFRKG